MPISLILADDHPLMLDGLRSLFRTEAQFRVLAQCTDGVQTLEAVRHHKPDILVLDLHLPRMSGSNVLRAINRKALPTRVVVLTAGLDEDQLAETVRLGAKGVVLKEMAPRLLVQCIREVHAGGEWLEVPLLGRVLGHLLSSDTKVRNAGLTDRELQIISGVSKGLQNKQIALELGIGEGTVKIHVHHIYAKLGLSNRVALAAYARENRLARA